MTNPDSRPLTSTIPERQPTIIGEYLAYHGGPYYDLQRRLGLLQEGALRSGKRALILVALAWGVPLLLSVMEGRAIGPWSDRPFLLDPTVWARFFIAVALFTLAERPIEFQLRKTLKQLLKAPVLAPSSFPAAAAALDRALRRRNSKAAEAVCLALGFAASFAFLLNLDQFGASSWAARGNGETLSLTVTGWWCLLVSNPVFWFLLFRCLWRELVWALFLRRVARLELRLVATHPDGKAGIAFIGEYPNAYSLFIFGLSCVTGAALFHKLLNEQTTVSTYGYMMMIWLVLILALFAFPLTGFTPALMELKRKTMYRAAAQATQYHRMAERKIFGENVTAADATEAERQAEIVDSSKHYDTVKKLSVYLLNRSTLVPVAAAALLPLFAAGATELPYKELWAIIKKLLLL